MEHDLAEQIGILESILNEDSTEEVRQLYKQEFDKEYPEHPFTRKESLGMVFISKGNPHYLARGGKSLVLRLDGSYVAKSNKHFLWNNYFVVDNRTAFTPRTSETVELFRSEFGFNSLFASLVKFEHEEGMVRVFADKRGYGYFMIMPDFTENGKYIVRDIMPYEDFSRFSNGSEAEAKFNQYVGCLIEMHQQWRNGKLPGLKIEIDGHVEKGDPGGAFKRMFFLKINAATNTAKIVGGDFNHAVFYKMPE